MQFGSHQIDLTEPKIMGILNVTPDSFSDGGSFNTLDRALRQAERMVAEGATFLDVGGESTRPGANEVELAEELDRVIPVIEAITLNIDAVVSIDTSKAQVMCEAVNAGAALINDVCALQNPGALETAAGLNVPVCLMHMQGKPRTMQQNPSYNDLLNEVSEFLKKRIQQCQKVGIDASQIMIDPGFGFGKSLEHNFQLLANLNQLHQLDVPILVGLSRKSMFGKLLNRDVDERVSGSIVAAAISVQHGAKIIRVHDVKETHDAVKVVKKVQDCHFPSPI